MFETPTLVLRARQVSQARDARGRRRDARNLLDSNGCAGSIPINSFAHYLQTIGKKLDQHQFSWVVGQTDGKTAECSSIIFPLLYNLMQVLADD